MPKIFLVLSLLIIMASQSAFAAQYNIPYGGFKVKMPDSEANVIGKDFYGSLHTNGDFVYVYSLNADQASVLLEQKFNEQSFNKDYAAIALLERSGIDPIKAEAKLANPALYWPADKPFIKPLPVDAVFNISTHKLKGKKSVRMEFTEPADTVNKKDGHLYSIDLLSNRDRLYVISSKTTIKEMPEEVKKDTKTVTEVATRDLYTQGVYITNPVTTVGQSLTYTENLADFKFQLPDDWYYVQSYFSTSPKACLTIALPLATLEQIKEKTKALEADQLEKEKIAGNVSEENVTSWIELLTEAVWSVSFENQGFEITQYLQEPESTKKEIQQIFSELKKYIESSRYYKNASFNFDVDITPKIGHVNFDLSFKLKDIKDLNNHGHIFFTKKKSGIIVYTSSIKDGEEQTLNTQLLENVKILNLK